MDADAFWSLIESTRADHPDNDDMLEALRSNLRALSPEELVEFQRQFDTCLVELYRWDVWGAAYVMNGGCSDDGFEYWRAMLISQGRQAYETALTNPDDLADLKFEGEAAEGEWEFEDLIYLADYVYEEKTGKEISREVSFPSDPAGNEWPEDTVHELYPKINQRFWPDE